MRIKFLFTLLFLCSFNLASLLRYGKLPYVTSQKKRIIPNHLQKYFPQRTVQRSLKRTSHRSLNDEQEVEPEATENQEEQVEGEEGEPIEEEVEGEEVEGEEGEPIEEEEVEGEEVKEKKVKEKKKEKEKEENVEEEEGEEEHVEGEGEEEHEEEVEEEPLPKNIESEEIQAAIELVEFKMTEINELMKECLETEFSNNPMAEKDEVLTECTGVNYQILFQNYKEAIRRVKSIFFELIKLKTSELDEEYDDEVSYFLDTLDQFIDMDYHIRDSLEIAKETVKYYVSPGFFDSLVEFSGPEIDAIEELLTNLKASRKSVQELVDEKTAEREEYLNSLKHEAEEIEEHEEVEDHGDYEEEPHDEGEYEEEEEHFEDYPEDKYEDEEHGEHEDGEHEEEHEEDEDHGEGEGEGEGEEHEEGDENEEDEEKEGEGHGEEEEGEGEGEGEEEAEEEEEEEELLKKNKKKKI